jgi:hypothetical protein
MPRTNGTLAAGLVLACALAALARAGDEAKRTWGFDDDAAGSSPRGFHPEVGRWTVAATDGGNKVLAQTAKNPDETFNVILADDPRVRDVDLSVRMKAIAGEFDQGGGLVWRARDAKNYYIVRHNPIEDNFRVYKVVDGERTQLGTADIPRSEGWHTVRAVMAGAHITCYYDGKKALDVEDSTFQDAGRVGLWSKADARSQFDDLTVVGR